MKTPIRMLRYLISFFLILGFATNLNGQLLKKLGKRAERAAERTVERRVEQANFSPDIKKTILDQYQLYELSLDPKKKIP